MNSITVKLALAVALLALATSGSLAKRSCRFEFSQSADATVTLIKVADKIAIIENGKDSTWKGYVKEAVQYSDNDYVIVADQTGETSWKQYKDLPEEERSLIDSVQHQPMTGIKVKVTAGGGFIDHEPTKENTLRTTHSAQGATKVSGKRESVFAHVDKMGLPYTHVFYQFGSVVTMVDSECMDVTIVPYALVSNELMKLFESKDFVTPSTF